MASFAPIRGTRTQIATTPIVDGQFLIETNQGANNRIYLDTGSTRSVVGGGTGKLPHLKIMVTGAYTTLTTYIVTVTNPDGTSTTPVTYTDTNIAECDVNGFGTYIINMEIVLVNSINGNTYTVSKVIAIDVNSVSEGVVNYVYIDSFHGYDSFIIDGLTDNWSEVVTQNNGTVTFTGLNPYLGYKLYFLSNDTGNLSIPKWTNINKTISNGRMTLTYTISGGTNGSTQCVLRILK